MNIKPPPGLTLALAGLWWDAKGDWTRAHESAQQDEGPEGSWVHAYLHRKEGDQGNAAYWYTLSQDLGSTRCSVTIEREKAPRNQGWVCLDFRHKRK